MRHILVYPCKLRFQIAGGGTVDGVQGGAPPLWQAGLQMIHDVGCAVYVSGVVEDGVSEQREVCRRGAAITCRSARLVYHRNATPIFARQKSRPCRNDELPVEVFVDAVPVVADVLDEAVSLPLNARK